MKKLPKQSQKLCPCHSGLSYSACCKPYHRGALPQTATQLMRSRYAAYAFGLTDYIIETTLDKDRVKEKAVLHFCKVTTFLGLEILDISNEGSSATVTFRAILSQSGLDTSFTEKSSFEKINGKWLYKEGVIH